MASGMRSRHAPSMSPLSGMQRSPSVGSQPTVRKVPPCASAPAQKETLIQKLETVAESVPGLSSLSRVIDVGSRSSGLIQQLQARGVLDILAVDTSPEDLAALAAQSGQSSRLGNDLGLRTWLGDFTQLPLFQGPVDAIFLSAEHCSAHSLRATLIKASLTVRPGCFIVLSSLSGRAGLAALAGADEAAGAGNVPERAALFSQISDLPLRVRSFIDEDDFYCAVLQVPPRYSAIQAPLQLDGKVVRGFGRGSRQMGTPTANIDPVPLRDKLQGLPKGVYFGWAQLQTPQGWPAADAVPHKTVLNIGARPTVNSDSADVTVECYILHDFQGGFEFYDSHLKVVALGYIRPEMKFNGLDALISRIKADTAIAKVQLDDVVLAAYKNDQFFKL